MRYQLPTSFALLLTLSTSAQAQPRPQPAAACGLGCEEPAYVMCPGACEPESPMPAPPLPAPVAASPAAPAAPRRPAVVALGLESGFGAYASLAGISDAATPFLGGELRILWPMRNPSIQLGLRMSLTRSFGMRQGSGVFESDSDDARYSVTMWGADLSFVASFYGFWISPGLGGLVVTGDRSFGLPDFGFALGYDAPLAQSLAFRFFAQGGTLLVSYRGTVGIGLVARF